MVLDDEVGIIQLIEKVLNFIALSLNRIDLMLSLGHKYFAAYMLACDALSN